MKISFFFKQVTKLSYVFILFWLIVINLVSLPDARAASDDMVRLPVNSNGAEGNEYSDFGHSSISVDERHEAFESDSRNLIATGTKQTTGIFKRANELVALQDAALGPNMVINGDFEAPDVTVSTFTSYFSGQSFGGWTVESGSVDHISERYWQAADGRQSLDLDGTCGVGAGVIYQDLVVPLLQTYLLRFALSGNPEGLPAIKQTEVWWGSTLVDIVTFDAAGHSKINMGWSFHEYLVTGTEAITRLRFKSLTPGCYGPVLDMISVQNYSGGEVPLLDLPLDYTGKKFSEVALGNVPGGKGWVNSWFDHDTPDYRANTHVRTWTGEDHTDTTANLNSRNCKTGINCYNGHNGIDYQRQNKDGNRIYAAAPGIVVDLCNDYPCNRPEGIITSDRSYGKWVLVQHGEPGNYGKYATFYAHLSEINPNLVAGSTEITDTKAMSIGTMGGTTSCIKKVDNRDVAYNCVGAVHLHFGVYFDANGNGKWEDKYQGYTEAVDPYGWFGIASDPWWNQSSYLWKYPLWDKEIVNQNGAIVTSPSGKGKLTIAAGVLSNPLSVELWDVPTVKIPFNNLKEAGHSVWLRVVELPAGAANNLTSGFVNPRNTSALGEFPQPISVNLRYGTDDTRHLNTNQLSIYWLNESTSAWIGLPTSINVSLKEATTQTANAGYFSLQAPLLCSVDTLEPNDNYDESINIQANADSANNLFDIAQDEDWFQFDAVAGTDYIVKTHDLTAGVDTILEIYDTDGLTVLASNDNSGGVKASSVSWTSPTNGVYFIRVKQAIGSTFGCSSAYSLTILASVIPTFSDVPTDYWARDFIQRLYAAGITGGCGVNPLRYCPEDTVTRAQMAVFLLRGIHGSSYTPPGVGAGTGFGDVPPGYWSATFIKQLAAEGVTTGCGNGNYCPEQPVTRAQMAVFLLRSKHGASYAPPGVGAGTGFGDVPPDYWSAAWIKQLVTEGITSGCGSGIYCPEQPVTRAQMAVFLVRTYSLP